MTEKIKGKPVAFSIISTLILSAFLIGITLFFRGRFEEHDLIVPMLISTVLNIVFAALAAYLLGVINQVNGFRFVFKTKGLAKGLLVLIPVATFFIFGSIINTDLTSEANIENVWFLPVTAFMQATSALMQNVLFRGLLVTALLIKLSGTEKERVRGVFRASALYLIIYIPLNILNGSGIGLMQIINTFIVGAGFCAAYLYSKNLMSLVLVQGAWQISDSVIYFLGFERHTLFSLPLFIALVAILILIVVFAVRFSKRAEPFFCHNSPHTVRLYKT